jgi:hypothetical protein
MRRRRLPGRRARPHRTVTAVVHVIADAATVTAAGTEQRPDPDARTPRRVAHAGGRSRRIHRAGGAPGGI